MFPKNCRNSVYHSETPTKVDQTKTKNSRTLRNKLLRRLRLKKNTLVTIQRDYLYPKKCSHTHTYP